MALEGNEGSRQPPSFNFLFVCHHWFEFVVRTPELWSSWGYSLRDWKQRRTSHRTARLDLQLRNSDSREHLDENLQNALQDRAARDTIRQVKLIVGSSQPQNSIISSITNGGEGIGQTAWSRSYYIAIIRMVKHVPGQPSNSSIPSPAIVSRNCDTSSSQHVAESHCGTYWHRGRQL